MFAGPEEKKHRKIKRGRKCSKKKEKFRSLCSVFVINFDYNSQMAKKAEKERKQKKPTIS